MRRRVRVGCGAGAISVTVVASDRFPPSLRHLRIALVAAALLCSGCQLRLHVDLAVDRNGGGVLAVAVSADEELQTRAAQADADPLGDLVAAGRELGQGWRVADDTDDAGVRTVTLTAPFADPQELAALSSEVAEALNADEVHLLDPLAVSLTDDEVTVTGGAAMEPTAAVADYGLAPRRVVRLLDRTDAFAYAVAVTMPGEVTSADGETTADSRAVTWQVEPGQRVAVNAVSTRPGPPILRAVAGAAAGALVAGVVLWLVTRRRRAAA